MEKVTKQAAVQLPQNKPLRPARGAQQQAEQDGQQGEQSMQQSMSQSQQDESAQATEQWLRRIPDDPGGLLRRKFYYQYQQRPRDELNEDEEFW